MPCVALYKWYTRTPVAQLVPCVALYKYIIYKSCVTLASQNTKYLNLLPIFWVLTNFPSLPDFVMYLNALTLTSHIYISRMWGKYKNGGHRPHVRSISLNLRVWSSFYLDNVTAAHIFYDFVCPCDKIPLLLTVSNGILLYLLQEVMVNTITSYSK